MARRSTTKSLDTRFGGDRRDINKGALRVSDRLSLYRDRERREERREGRRLSLFLALWSLFVLLLDYLTSVHNTKLARINVL